MVTILQQGFGPKADEDELCPRISLTSTLHHGFGPKADEDELAQVCEANRDGMPPPQRKLRHRAATHGIRGLPATAPAAGL